MFNKLSKTKEHQSCCIMIISHYAKILITFLSLSRFQWLPLCVPFIITENEFVGFFLLFLALWCFFFCFGENLTIYMLIDSNTNEKSNNKKLNKMYNFRHISFILCFVCGKWILWNASSRISSSTSHKRFHKHTDGRMRERNCTSDTRFEQTHCWNINHDYIYPN